MPVNFNPDLLPGNVEVLADLVRAIATSGDSNGERYWLEWKSSLPLDRAEGRFQLAKEILAMANREVRRSATTAHGAAYVIVGANEHGIVGIEPIRTAELELGLNPFLGLGQGSPHWVPELLTIDEKLVLVVVVQAPKDGDPIFPLRKDFANARAGTIYVRGVEISESANPDQLAMLQDRLMTGSIVDRMSERLALVSSSLSCDLWFNAPLPGARAFAIATSRIRDVRLNIWVEFLSGGTFDKVGEYIRANKSLAYDHLLVIIPRSVSRERIIDAAKETIISVFGGRAQRGQGQLIVFADDSFGGVHAGLDVLLNGGPEGVVPLGYQVAFVRVPRPNPHSTV